jgi:hypothetical protein
MASTHAKMLKAPGGSAPVEIKLCDMGGLWPAMEKGKETFERGALPFSDDFDSAIGLIAHPADETEIDGVMLGRVAKADTLHTSVNDGVKLLLMRFSHDESFPL